MRNLIQKKYTSDWIQNLNSIYHLPERKKYRTIVMIKILYYDLKSLRSLSSGSGMDQVAWLLGRSATTDSGNSE